MKSLRINIPVSPGVIEDLDRGMVCEFRYESDSGPVDIFLMPLPAEDYEVPDDGLRSSLKFPHEGERESTTDVGAK